MPHLLDYTAPSQPTTTPKWDHDNPSANTNLSTSYEHSPVRPRMGSDAPKGISLHTLIWRPLLVGVMSDDASCVPTMAKVLPRASHHKAVQQWKQSFKGKKWESTVGKATVWNGATRTAGSHGIVKAASGQFSIPNVCTKLLLLWCA